MTQKAIFLTDPLRKCRDCGLEAYTEEDLDLFKSHKNRPYNRDCWCKKCYNKYQNHRKRVDDRVYLKHKYNDMMGRCYNPNHMRYPYYGAREITVCDLWVNNPDSFVEWAISNGWERGLTIERKNNEGPYGPGNCRWATMKEQGANKRNKVTFLEKGTRICCRCKVEKPLTDFHVDRRAPQEHTYVCKECRKTSRSRGHPSMSQSMTKADQK